MTATLGNVTDRKRKDKPEPTAEQKLAEELVARAREQGVSLTGPDGLLKQLTKTVLETALNQEMTEHLGHDKHGLAGNETGNVRNGTRPKTVLTEASGQVPIEVPRSWSASTSSRPSGPVRACRRASVSRMRASNPATPGSPGSSSRSIRARSRARSARSRRCRAVPAGAVCPVAKTRCTTSSTAASRSGSWPGPGMV